MAGIYLHIPFCKQACFYCDFHFSTQTGYRREMVEAIAKEMELRKDYLKNDKISTIYFGGGTPSLLDEKEIHLLLAAIHRHFQVEKNAEITLEANPDDLTVQKLQSLKQAGINRLSIGVQSFFDEHLKWMNRVHNVAQAIDSVKSAADAGFSNISMDLISGIPMANNDQWKTNLLQVFELPVQHLSCYSLTVEPKTPLAAFIKKGISPGIDEEQAAFQLEDTMKTMQENGWLHYEISNYCKPGYFSKHNSSYWSGEKYLGVGPSAHSFDGDSRQWNVADNRQYLKSISEGRIPFQKEILSETQKINERILTSLRTMWGLEVSGFRSQVSDLIKEKSKLFEKQDLVVWNQDTLILTNNGKLVADKIIVELMLDEERILAIFSQDEIEDC